MRHLPAGAGLDEAYLPFLAALAPADPAAALDVSAIARMREAAVRIRSPWQVGGAVMHQTIDDSVVSEHGRLPIRVYYPNDARPLPTLVYLHGGGWSLLGIETHDRLMREFAAWTGWAVVGIAYPLAPEVRFPDTVYTCSGGLNSLLHAASRLGLTAPWALAGDSAGANLALACALNARDRGRPMPDALVLSYGVYDGTRYAQSYAQFSGLPLTLSKARMDFFWDMYCPDLSKRKDPLASPAVADLAGLPPVRLMTTGMDILRDENLALAVRLAEAGNVVSLDHHPRAPHAFLEALALHDEAARAVSQSAAWLTHITAA
jgi:acetyl esterase